MPETTYRGAEGADTMAAAETVTILYENYRGETAVRRITPIAREWFGSSDWHPEPQWLFTAFDMDKEVFRDFARSGVKAWGQAAVDAALSAPASPGVPDSLREKIRLAVASVNVHAEASEYEFRADEGDHTPTDAERAMLEDFGEQILSHLEASLLSTHPAGQSAVSGAGLDMPLAEDVQFPGVKFGKGVTLRTVIEAARRWKADADAAVLAKLPASASDSLRPDWHRAMFPDEPAPDSTRTGDDGTEEPEGFREALETADLVLEACDDLFSEIRDDYTDPRSECRRGKSLISDMRHVIQKSLAARPAAPEAQGAWRLQHLIDLDDLACAKATKAAASLSSDRHTYADGYQNGIIQMSGWVRSAIRQAVPSFDAEVATLPAPPASSRQGGR